MRFNKGDAVPHWVLNVSPNEKVKSVTFGVDVVVTADESGVTVKPANPLADGECFVLIEGEDGLQATGAPTHWDTRADTTST